MSRRITISFILGSCGALVVALALNLLIAAQTPAGMSQRRLGWGPIDLATVSRVSIDETTSSVTLQQGWAYWALILVPFVVAWFVTSAASRRTARGGSASGA